MKTIALTTSLLISSAYAQTLPDMQFEHVGLTELYVAPTSLNVQLSEVGAPSVDVCQYGRTLMKSSIDSIKKYNCTKRSSNAICEVAKRAVNNFAFSSLGNLGEANFEMNWEVQKYSSREMAQQAQYGAGYNLEDIHVVGLQDLLKANWDLDFKITDKDNIYVDLAKRFDLSEGINTVGDLKGKLIVTNRLAYCVLKEGAIEVEGKAITSIDAPVMRSTEDMNKYFDFYNEVKKRWNEQSSTEWVSPLHGVLIIGVILKEEAINFEVEKMFSLEQNYENFFEDSFEDEEYSVYLKNFENRDSFNHVFQENGNQKLNFETKMNYQGIK